MSNVGAAIAQLDAGGNHQAIGENGGSDAAPVAVRVLEDEDFVVWHLTGFNLRIDRAADDPQPPARVEAHLNWFDDAVLLRREEIDRKTVGDLERSQFSGGIIRVPGQRGSSKHQTPGSKKAPVVFHSRV